MLQHRRQAERSTAFHVQQTSENRRRVKIGKTKKIDRGIYTNQGHRLQVSDDTVVLNRLVFSGHICFLHQFVPFPEEIFQTSKGKGWRLRMRDEPYSSLERALISSRKMLIIRILCSLFFVRLQSSFVFDVRRKLQDFWPG